MSPMSYQRMGDWKGFTSE